MKLLELTIDNIRGIRHLELKPEGKNFLISGPNGSGKSAVVDSIDFLLTGEISRMKGKGTKGITLNKHGKHIDAQPKEAQVRALVKLPGVEEPVEVMRSFSSPKNLVVDESCRAAINPILELASRGQHVLTRREILNFVTAEAGTRATQVQKLLRLESIDDYRKKLNKVKNTIKKDYQSAARNLDLVNAAINTSIGLEDSSETEVLEFINSQRSILGGEPITELNAVLLKKELHPPAMCPENSVNPILLENDLNNLINISSSEELGKKENELMKLSSKISNNPLLKDAVKRLKLTQTGLDLLDDTGRCPLCETSWDPAQLKEHLEENLHRYQEAKDDLNRLDLLSNEIIEYINRLKNSLDEVKKARKEWKLEDNYHELDVWRAELNKLSEEIGDLDRNSQKINLCVPENLSQIIKELLEVSQTKSSPPSPEQTSWDQLTRLEENLKNLENAQEDYTTQYESYQRAEILLQAFEESREEILNQLYSDIKDRFVELYRELHGIDEAEFEAALTSAGAGIDFQVDFHGRGEHPPHALHSEGHQDSMGICLYLALAERLTQGYIDLIILDDVMMSVDAPHRRKICHLLADFFKGRQFFITTHDQTWARQLQSEGVVRGKDRIELSNWTIQDGPSINYMGNIWDPIEEDLKRNDVPAAAAKLRRGSEEYFSLVCSALQAPVKFKFSGQYELGDLLSGALSAYRKQLKQAKTSARSWEKYEELERLTEMENYSKSVFGRINIERWAVNPAVHYNQWADFTIEDFKPVVDSFQDLFSIFQCEVCGTIVHLVMNEATPEAVKCNCGSLYWNLKGK